MYTSKIRSIVGRLHPLGGYTGPALVATAVLAVVGVGLIGFSAQPGMAISVSADDVSITTDDGTISSVYVEPSMTVSWDGLDAAPSAINLSLQTTDGNGGVVTMRELQEPVAGTTGSVTFDPERIDILQESSQYSAVDFSASEGSTATTTVYLRVYASTDGGTFEQTSDTTSFQVVVTNSGGTLSTTGSYNTGVAA